MSQNVQHIGNGENNTVKTKKCQRFSGFVILSSLYFIIKVIIIYVLIVDCKSL